MLILSLRTDKPEAEIGLYKDGEQLTIETWQAHRLLAETLHTKIKEVLATQGEDEHNLQGIICYKGPGSFTGLRIGLSVANAMAYGLGIPIVGNGGENWQSLALVDIQRGVNNQIVLPEYGAPVHITTPKK